MELAQITCLLALVATGMAIIAIVRDALTRKILRQIEGALVDLNRSIEVCLPYIISPALLEAMLAAGEKILPVRLHKATSWKCTNPGCDHVGPYPDEDETTGEAECPKCGSAMM